MPDIQFSAQLDASVRGSDGLITTEFSVPDMHCGGCMMKIENGIGDISGVRAVRANLTKRRVRIVWEEETLKTDLQHAITGLGFDVTVLPADSLAPLALKTNLMPALALSGFVAGNVMMMSVAVWAGAGETMRQVLHTLSGILALVSLVFAGPVFFKSAYAALRQGRSNMDVPISVGLLLTFAISLAQTFQSAEHAYFDAVTGLLFFLLVGRTLDQTVRQKIGSAVDDMQRLLQTHYQSVTDRGDVISVKLNDIRAGALLLIQPGERIPVDGIIREGRSDVDVAIINGESQPDCVTRGHNVSAGTLNLTSTLTVEASGDTSNSLLAEMAALIEGAEINRSRHRRLADRVARYYTPVVYIAALVTFLAWFAFTQDAYHSTIVAVSVLIITCPCALALAIPMVQVVASRKLLKCGVLMKDGAALERLNSVDHVIFDKTGTLTMGVPRLLNSASIPKEHLSTAAALAQTSRHPYSQAIRRAAADIEAENNVDWKVTETAGAGIEGIATSRGVYRLGRSDWALEDEIESAEMEDAAWTVLSRDGDALARFSFEDSLRHDAAGVIAELEAAGLPVQILSGDDPREVSRIAKKLRVDRYRGAMKPEAKVKAIQSLSQEGCHTLMVGDGLNDAPALSAAFVSMAPSTAADIGRNKADFVLMGAGMSGVIDGILIAKRAHALIRQNLALAITYNLIAVPIAMAGAITPLIAAIAMSASSLIVVLNSMRFPGRTYESSEQVRVNSSPAMIIG